jgi:hypothetical protein
MHATTLQKSNYYLKTQQGISTSSYSNETGPVYGNGQGAGDSPSQWSQESAMLFQIYQELATGATMSNRNGTPIVDIHMTAFADDTNLLGNNDGQRKHRADDMIEELKLSFTHWNRLLHATGHSMELSKCACYLAFWTFSEFWIILGKGPPVLKIA